MSERIRDILIVGGGTAGWMAAAGLSRLLSASDIRIRLVESESIGTVGVGEATIPHIKIFNDLLAFKEDDFVRETNATFKLGIEFNDWGHLGESYFHSFGRYGIAMEGINFWHYWQRHRANGGRTSVDEYNLQVMAAYLNKFQRPVNVPNSPLSNIGYAFQFDASLYARFMRKLAEGRGVRRIEGRVIDVALHPETGHVHHVTLDGGLSVEGDFWIDCSGFRGLLIEQALESGYDDWSDMLPVDRAVAQASERIADPMPFTRATAKTAGWQWRIPLQSRTGNGHVYCSEYMSDDEATATLHAGMDAAPIGTPKYLRFKTGIRRKPWNKNVVSLGLAQGFLEPLESTSIHLIQSGIARLMANFPDLDFAQANIDYFNERTRVEYEEIRDFLMLHYVVTRRDDSPFWDYVRTMPITDSLQLRIDQFKQTARVYHHGKDIFGTESWFAVMHGQGLRPRGYHPMANRMTDEELENRLGQIRRTWKACLDQMPRHSTFIDQHCRAPAA